MLIKCNADQHFSTNVYNKLHEVDFLLITQLVKYSVACYLT